MNYYYRYSDATVDYSPDDSDDAQNDLADYVRTAELEEKLKLMHAEVMRQLCASPGLSGSLLGSYQEDFLTKIVDFVELFYTMPHVQAYVKENPCFVLPARDKLLKLADNDVKVCRRWNGTGDRAKEVEGGQVGICHWIALRAGATVECRALADGTCG